MSRCSAIVFTVNGRVGLVEEGSTFACAAILMMSGARALGMIRVNRAPGDGSNSVLDKPSFVQSVGMNRDLYIVFIGGLQTGIDSRRGGTPILVQLQAAGPGEDLLGKRLPGRRV